MRKFGVSLALTGAAVWLTGCGMQYGGQATSRGGIAVVDLDKIASETGKGIEMNEAVKSQKSRLEQELLQLQLGVKVELEKMVKVLTDKGDAVTNDEKLQFAQMRQNASRNLSAAQSQANTLLSNFQQSEVAKFRTELKPILNETAAKRGLAVVIPKNDGLLLTIDPGIDITDEVIKAYRARKPAPAPAAQANAQPAQKAVAPARTALKDSKASDGESN